MEHEANNQDLQVIYRRCTGCKELKQLEAFSRFPPGSQNYKARNPACKQCVYAEKQAKRQAEMEEALQKRIAYLLSMPYEQRIEAIGKEKFSRHLRSRYQMVLARYEAMIQEQRGLCAICHNPPKENERLVVDHDHTTGTIRGLLCSSCNWGLGHFKDNPDNLLNAAQYLRSSTWKIEE